MKTIIIIKKTTTITMLAVFLAAGVSLSSAKSHGNENGMMNKQENNENEMGEKDEHTVDFSTYEKGTLTEEEKKAIIHMREEEKMARDVYRELSKTTDSKTFKNIPVSENKHMDVFSQLIERYGLEDPIKDESARGVFTNKDFEKLYKDLTEKGKKSDKDAFEAGVMVEDINMANLIKYGNATDKKDLKLAYDTLLEQSKHHMSAFYRNLKRVGGDFAPQYITANQLNEAVSSGKTHMEEEADNGQEKAKEMIEEMESKGHNEKMERESHDYDKDEGKENSLAYLIFAGLGGLLIGLFLTKYFKKSKNKND